LCFRYLERQNQFGFYAIYFIDWKYGCVFEGVFKLILLFLYFIFPVFYIKSFIIMKVYIDDTPKLFKMFDLKAKMTKLFLNF